MIKHNSVPNSLLQYSQKLTQRKNMNINIIKGTNEIGGSCIKVSTTTTTILLDYGLPLSEESKEVTIDFPIDAVLISHPHQDHFGNIEKLDGDTPIYCGKIAKELMNARVFAGKPLFASNFHHFESGQSFMIGDIQITPFLVDHSAGDAYAFLVEADGKKLFYTGDFRDNGRKAKLFDYMTSRKELKNVDCMLMEGTMIERDNGKFQNESDVEEEIASVINSPLPTFIINSSQNIDNMISAFRACKKEGKTLVTDFYTAWILYIYAQNGKSIPNFKWENIKVLTSNLGKGPKNIYYDKIKEPENKKYFGNFIKDVYENSSNHIKIEDMKDGSDYLFVITPSHIKKAMQKLKAEKSNIIYSQYNQRLF